MIDNQLALAYWEPENLVMSRSGDECIVALCDQWILKYGEEHWKEEVKRHVRDTFFAYNDIVHKEFEEVLDWFQ